MISISQLKTFMQSQNQAIGIAPIAKHCGCSAEQTRTIIMHWCNKGKIKLYKQPKCQQCPVQNCHLELFLWSND